MVEFNKINPNISTSRIGSKKADKQETINPAPVQPEAPKTDFLPADEVFSYMSNTGLPLDLNKGEKSEQPKSTTVIEVSRFVTPEQAKRIAGYVDEVEDFVNVDGLNYLKADVGNIPEFTELSDEAKQALLLAVFNKMYMPE